MKKRSILAILLAALLALTIFTGCAASTNSMAADSAPQTPGASYNSKSEAAAAEMPMEEPAAAEEFAYDTVATTEAGGSAAETPEPDDSVADYTAKIIYTASVSIETTEFDKAVAALENQVQKIGGFVESSNVTGDTQYNSDGTTTVVNRWAYYTVRIPCDHFESFLHETEGFGNVTSTSRDAQNVTSAYTDYEARLSSLNTQEERLLDMLAKSEDVETLIALEQRLSDVRYEIESIERSLRNYDMQIKYSTVNLDLREVEVYTPTVPVRRTFGQKLADSLSDGWNGFTRGIQNVILGLASALPALILLAVIIAAVIVCIKKARKKRKAKKAAQDPTHRRTRSKKLRCSLIGLHRSFYFYRYLAANLQLPAASGGHIFSHAREKIWKKRALGGRGVQSASEFRQEPMFWSGVPLGSHLTYVLVRAA